MTQPLYRDPSQSIDARVDDLLSRMTIEEKAGQLTQYFYLGGGELPEGFDIESLPPEHRAFVEQPRKIEAAMRDGRVGSALFVKDPSIINRLQRLAVEESRLGVPLLFGFDVIHGLRTVFPVPVALAASWSPAQVERAQSVAAREARAVGINWTFAPMIDISRDPRWGRMVEGAGEDPVLGSAVAAAQVRGFQGSFGSDSVLAGPKHLAGYGAPRGGRDYEDVELSDSELWNVYLPPFQAAVDAGAANIMSAYMDLNGVPASANRWLLNDVLRGHFGFKGFVVSDANAVRSLVTQHFAKDLTDAAARAVSAGLDMEMAMEDAAFANLPAAVAAGLVSESDIHIAARRVLAAKIRLGLFESPFVDESATAGVLAAEDHREAAREAAESSFVLLKNEGTLPLRDRAESTIAVIGQLADSPRDQLGPWVFDHDTAESVTVLDGIRRRFSSASVEYAPGAGIPERLFPSQFDQADPTITATPSDWDDDAEIARAVEIASAADVAIVVVGQRQNQAGEKASSATLDLPGRQLEQLQRIAETGTEIVLLVMSGRPLDLRWANEHIPAIVQVWYPGTRGGDAIAATLAGDVSPAGRLPFTWPRHVGQVPVIYAHQRTFEPDNAGSRYYEEESTPLFPFGFGLSYATFEYGELTLDRDSMAIGETARIAISIRNTSDRVADEVVQLYVHQQFGSASRPVRELKAFERVALRPNASRTVEFVLGPSQLRYWNAASRTHQQDATVLHIGVGGDSATPLTRTLEVRA